MSGGDRHPPRVPFGLSVGITGHRIEALPQGEVLRLRQQIAEALERLRSEAMVVLGREKSFFAESPPNFTLVSPLASGVDQMAAQAALDADWELQVVLPLRQRDYRAQQDDASAHQLDALVAAACCTLELPGDPGDPVDAYVMAGRATVSHCDVLIAVWDGLPARGRGGTAQTVDMALARGTPILHLPVDPSEPAMLLWSALDPAVITHSGNHGRGRPASAELIGRVLTALLAPPPSPTERRFYRRFISERPYGLHWRLEYPLLMAIAGAHRISRGDLLAEPAVGATHAEWEAYRRQCLQCHGVTADIEQLEDAYSWADRLASHFAQTYRSGHVFNFLLAALGTLIGLSGLVLSLDPMATAMAEFAIILAVVTNTLVGSRRCWHQRWLDYRQVAERLRPMRSLKLLGIAAPDPPGTAAEPVASRWIDWYAAGLWRTMGCPAGRLTPEGVKSLAGAVAIRELEPQIGYHNRSAEQSQRFDDRLEFVALALFVTTILVTLSVIIGLQVDPDLVNSWSNPITFFSAGLPAVGTAIFGIRVQGDFGNVAARCRNTATLLQRIAVELAAGPSLDRAADLTEQAGRVMLQDLDQWRLVAELHELSIG